MPCQTILEASIDACELQILKEPENRSTNGTEIDRRLLYIERGIPGKAFFEKR